MVDNKDTKKVEEVLPLLSAEQARKIVSSLTEEQELQKIADLIRSRVEAHLSDLNAVYLRHPQYIFNELIKKKYIVRFSNRNSLYISWE